MERLSGVLITCVLILAACKNGTLQDEVPARAGKLEPSELAELRTTVSAALGGVDVLLSDKAFSESSTLIIERRAGRDPQGNRLPGRDLGRPEKFHLVLSGGQCVLVQESSGQRWELRNLHCVPEEPGSL